MHFWKYSLLRVLYLFPSNMIIQLAEQTHSLMHDTLRRLFCCVPLPNHSPQKRRGCSTHEWSPLVSQINWISLVPLPGLLESPRRDFHLSSFYFFCPVQVVDRSAQAVHFEDITLPIKPLHGEDCLMLKCRRWLVTDMKRVTIWVLLSRLLHCRPVSPVSNLGISGVPFLWIKLLHDFHSVTGSMGHYNCLFLWRRP